MLIKVTNSSAKGGVGNATLTATQGSVVAVMSQRLLFVRIDCQSTLSRYFLRVKPPVSHGLMVLGMGSFDTSDEKVWCKHRLINHGRGMGK